jgi:hypothetical protein
MKDWMWGWATTEINAYVLLENAFPSPLDADKFVKKIINSLPHSKDAGDLLSRVSNIGVYLKGICIVSVK